MYLFIDADELGCSCYVSVCIAVVKLLDGTIRTAEVHWYEAHGVGKKKLKIKRWVE